jgi:hypothetical protein
MAQPEKRKKTMAKSKSGKAVSNLDVVNNDLKAQFEGVVNLDAELAVYEKAVRMLNSGDISVRGLKATIEAAQEKGALPTIKPTTAQYFLDSAKVRALAGGKEKPLKDVLNATIQAKRSFGKEGFESTLASVKSFAELVKATPKQGEKAKAGRKASEPVADVDGFIALFLGVRDLKGEALTIKNVENFEKFQACVKMITEWNRRNHPALAKVKAKSA